MNYAADALWWRLRHPAIRALASLLTAPPLWHSGSELPVRELLGTQGFRLLLEWDGDPSVHSRLNAEAGERLGRYAERLLAFWLQHAPHCRLLAQEWPVHASDGRRLGALDFVALINGRPCHIELCVKYYGGSRAETLCGLNPQDRFADKAGKLSAQLALSRHPAAQAALAATGIPLPLHSVSVVRGMGFAPEHSSVWQQPPLNPLGWHGQQANRSLLVQLPENTRCAVLPRHALLAPARLPETETVAAGSIGRAPAMIALLETRPDGYWHETQRLMLADLP